MTQISSPLLLRMKTILQKALDETQSLWPPIKYVYKWVHKAAKILKNEDGLSSKEVMKSYRGLIGMMSRFKDKAESLESALDLFIKVTRSFWPGLFHAYSDPDLPKTNNDIEQLFNAVKSFVRKISGHKKCSSRFVLRGEVIFVVIAATRKDSDIEIDTKHISLAELETLRMDLHQKHGLHIQRYHFRRNPDEFLKSIENKVIEGNLPS